jgi:hypothetical protein
LIDIKAQLSSSTPFRGSAPGPIQGEVSPYDPILSTQILIKPLALPAVSAHAKTHFRDSKHSLVEQGRLLILIQMEMTNCHLQYK